MYEFLGNFSEDGLVSGLAPETLAKGVTIRTGNDGSVVKRGTVLAKSSDGTNYAVLGSDPATSSQKFSGDGTTTAFTVTAKPAAIKSITVGGTAVTAYTYNASTGVITFTSAPAAGTNNIEATYEIETLAVDCILAEDVVASAATVTAAAYQAGCFDPNKLIVAEGYTMSDADFDELRKLGIFFKEPTL